jgi:hypothetical protein
MTIGRAWMSPQSLGPLNELFGITLQVRLVVIDTRNRNAGKPV